MTETTTVLTLAPEAIAPSRARAFVAAALVGDQYESARELAQLLVSELVTNAVVHAASPVAVEIELTLIGDVVVRVVDADTGPLVIRPGSGGELDEGGRGFMLVDRLADAWGTEHRGGRKTVWFRLDAADPPLRPARPEHVEAYAPARTVERRLRSLLVRPDVANELAFDQHVGELTARVLEAVDGRCAQVQLAGATHPLIEIGDVNALVRRTVDLVADDRQLGTLSVGFEAEPSDEDDAFLSLAAARLALLVSEHGVADARTARESDLDFFSEATEMLAGSLSVSMCLTLLSQIVVPRLADWCAVFSVDDRRRPRRVAANHRREERVDSVYAALDGDRELWDATVAAAKGHPARRLPVTITVGGQRNHVVVVPLVSRSRSLGVLLLGSAEAVDAIRFMTVLELGRRAGLAVDNARLHEEQVATATALQASLLPPVLPVVAGLRLAARYHSASPGMLVGGDFYDVVSAADGSFVLAIGDVCGKGAEAAAITGLSRDLLRVLVQDGHELSDSLRRLNRALLEHPNASRFCTVALARLRPKGDRVEARICLAGHPEPVILRSDGSTELVGVPGDLLGVLQDDLLTLEVSEATLGPGDSLVLYTDGVTERRDGRRMFGQYGLRDALASCRGVDADALAEALEDATYKFVDAELRDDLAILVAQTA